MFSLNSLHPWIIQFNQKNTFCLCEETSTLYNYGDVLEKYDGSPKRRHIGSRENCRCSLYFILLFYIVLWLKIIEHLQAKTCKIYYIRRIDCQWLCLTIKKPLKDRWSTVKPWAAFWERSNHYTRSAVVEKRFSQTNRSIENSITESEKSLKMKTSWLILEYEC